MESAHHELESEPEFAEKMVELFLRTVPPEDLQEDPVAAITTWSAMEHQAMESFLLSKHQAGALGGNG